MKPTAYAGTATTDTQPRKKYGNHEKGWYVRFDDDKMNYKDILSIT